MVEYDSIKVKDQLGRPEDKNITPKRFSENVIVEVNTSEVRSVGIGNSFILGSSINGVLGDPALAKNGVQVVLGSTGRISSVIAVTNPNKIYREHFRDAHYAGAANSCDWAGTEGLLSIVTNDIAVSTAVAWGDGTVSKAVYAIVTASGDDTVLTHELTADGGSNWETVTVGVEHLFTNTGDDLRFRITSVGTVDVNLVRIAYS